jgi:hypothetical protein
MTEELSAEEMYADLPPNVVIVFGERQVLHPLQGRKARMMFPRLVEFAARILFTAQKAQVSILSLLQGEPSQDDIYTLIVALSRTMAVEMWEEVETNFLPFLLQLDEQQAQRLEEEGDPFEIYWSLWRAIQYHVKVSLDKPALAALRRLLAEAARRGNSPEVAEKATKKET